MGTRFMCTVEAPIHRNVKDAIVSASENDTQLVLRRWRNTSRLYKNKPAMEAARIEKESATGEFKEVQPLVSGQRGRMVFVDGDVDHGVWTAGQVVGLIHDVPTCKELVERIEREALETLMAKVALAQSVVGGDGEENGTEKGVVADGGFDDGKGGVARTGGQTLEGKEGLEGGIEDKKDQKVGKEENHPQAQLWGVGEKGGSGKSKL